MARSGLTANDINTCRYVALENDITGIKEKSDKKEGGGGQK